MSITFGILLQVCIDIIRGQKKGRYVKKLQAHYNAWTELNPFPALKEVIDWNLICFLKAIVFSELERIIIWLEFLNFF